MTISAKHSDPFITKYDNLDVSVWLRKKSLTYWSTCLKLTGWVDEVSENSQWAHSVPLVTVLQPLEHKHYQAVRECVCWEQKQQNIKFVKFTLSYHHRLWQCSVPINGPPKPVFKCIHASQWCLVLMSGKWSNIEIAHIKSLLHYLDKWYLTGFVLGPNNNK